MKKSALIALLILCSFLWAESLQAQNAITFWKNGIPTIVFSPDSIFFWKEDASNTYGKDNYEEAELTEAELAIEQAPSDDGDDVPVAIYTEEDSLRYDAMAQEVIAMFDTDDEPDLSRKAGSTDEQAEEVIRNNGKNIFENPKDGSLKLIIEQQNWNSGQWGKTRYGGFKTFWTTSWENGKKCLLVVFYHKGGFPNKKTAYLKLGQLNNGKNGYKDDHYKTIIYPGRKYGFIRVYIDDYLPDYGLVNFFPLLVTEGSEARNYLNPILVQSDPIVPDGWADLPYGAVFGKINGVPVYCNTSDKKNQGSYPDYKYQCVELCKRYIKTMCGLDATGSAIEWPEKRGNDPDHYIVFANDGSEKVREGDIVVWNYGTWGHVGVVIKTTEKNISVAHQNGGGNLRPIDSTLKIENGIIKDTMLGTSIIAFIRVKNKYEVEDKEEGHPLFRASTTNMDFGEVEVSKSQTKKFKIENTGTSVLTISSIELSKGKYFSTDGSGCTLEPNEIKTFTVTFTPTTAEGYMDRLVIRSDAEEVIQLNGIGYGDTPSVDIPTDGLVAYYPFNGNANDESGYGNHGTVIGHVELAPDRFGNADSAYRFFGESMNYISIPDDESLHLSIFTLNAWVYTDAEDYGSGVLINKGRDINNGSYRLYVRNVGATNLYGGVNDAYIEYYPETKVWHMVTGTVEGDKARFYLDGVLMDERTLSNPFYYSNAEPLTLGMHYYGGVPSYWAYPLLGVMDDVRIYNRILTDSEIIALYNEQK